MKTNRRCIPRALYPVRHDERPFAHPDKVIEDGHPEQDREDHCGHLDGLQHGIQESLPGEPLHYQADDQSREQTDGPALRCGKDAEPRCPP